jgi:hypothetical protein
MTRHGSTLVLALVAGPLAAQRPLPPARGVAAITADGVRRRIGIIADDSMLGRATPSPQLDQVAAYVAGEFRRFGLTPGGDSGTYLQRYPLEVQRFDPESTAISVVGRAPTTWRIGHEVLLLAGMPPVGDTTGQAVLVTGSLPGERALDPSAVTGKVIFLAYGPGLDAIARKVSPLRPLALMVVAAFPDSVWQRLPGHAASVRVRNLNEENEDAIQTAFWLRAPAARALFALAGVGADSLRAWGERPLATHPLGGITLHLAVHQRRLERTSAPNVIGILEGSDPTRKREYVLFTAHMDHLGTPGSGEGCETRGADSICNGADDDGSGTVAVIELAEAFATAGERPKRSLVFMTVSGEERGLWGSAYFADHPTVPLASVVADLNSDMIGRNAKDTLAVIGREYSNLGATLDSVAAAHAELGIKPVGDLWPQEGLFFRSDHYNFAKKGVPILFFTTGLHPDYHQVTDSPDKIDVEKEARLTRLLFYLGLAVANGSSRPQWKPESYQRIVGGGRRAPGP